ncbi:M48 family metallopeptidase [uncultured Mailhella sp.]|uniref:M48 family metallopeptidase n=1 Tax=uncultured Mailhella sp. TaxID=1981031 RepID=UPI002614598D|nr:M48 family metallopeptidase [uncultured Mailhella sp.]
MRLRTWIAAFCMAGLLLAPFSAHAALFGEFTLQDEMKMGREFSVLVTSSMPMADDPEIREYAQSIVDRIVSVLPPQPYKFPVQVVLHDSLNAFAAPGGFVFVYSGLMMQLRHESELAGVLAHEIAHVTQRHIAGRVERGKVMSLASLAGMLAGLAAGIAGGGDAGGALMAGSMAASSAAMLNYSRVDEDDADRFGMQYLIKAGYPSTGMGGAFEVLKSQDWGIRGSMPTYLSTHPDLNLRLARIRTELQSLPASLRTRGEDDSRFRRIQTLLWARYGDPVLAERFFEARGKTAVGFLGKGVLAARRNRVKEAEAAFSSALKLAPRDALILREAGIFEYTKGDMGRARRHLEEALRLAPRDYYGLFYYARLLDESGEPGKAQQRYREVLRFVPEDREVHACYGRSLGASRKLSEGYLHLAYAALYGGDMRKARNLLEKSRTAASTPEERQAIKKYEEIAREREKIMKSAR